MTSRSIGLTAAFLALAAGGTAACDNNTPDEEYYEYDSSDVTSYSGDTGWTDPDTSGVTDHR